MCAVHARSLAGRCQPTAAPAMLRSPCTGGLRAPCAGGQRARPRTGAAPSIMHRVQHVQQCVTNSNGGSGSANRLLHQRGTGSLACVWQFSAPMIQLVCAWHVHRGVWLHHEPWWLSLAFIDMSHEDRLHSRSVHARREFARRRRAGGDAAARGRSGLENFAVKLNARALSRLHDAGALRPASTRHFGCLAMHSAQTRRQLARKLLGLSKRQG